MNFRIDPRPEILFGPPGTGKTTQLISILREELRQGTPPDRIALLTFTRQAATEAMDRVIADFPDLRRADFPNFRTIHSLCKRWSNIDSKSVLEGEKIKEFGDWIGHRITGRQSVDGVWSGYEQGDRLLFMENLARIRRIPLRQLYEQDHDDLDWATVERFSRGLREYKQAHDLHDFSDMLEEFVQGSARPKVEVVLVDEFQDLSLLQLDVIRTLAQGARRVGLAGDDDQGIFEWAGAAIDTLIDLDGESTVLDQSYRVPRRVQLIANRVIGRVRHRHPKTWQPRDAEGRVRHIRRVEDADLTGDSIMILARNRHMLDPVERNLRGAGRLYSREGQPSVRRAVLDAIVVWERLRRGEPQLAKAVVDGPYALMTVGAGLSRGHRRLPKFEQDARVTMDDLRTQGGLKTDAVWHVALDKMAPEDRVYLRMVRRNGERLTQEPKVRLSTIHSAKGSEADRVVLMTDIAPRTWAESRLHPDAENRVLYVALTRAREELIIVAARDSRSYDL